MKERKEIEGEEGYIYIKNGANGIAEVQVVTKDSDETFNAQPNPDRWFYEAQKVTELVTADDYEAFFSRLETMVSVIETIEESRKAAGIFFPGD